MSNTERKSGETSNVSNGSTLTRDIFIPILVALVALAGSIIGTYQANTSNRETQRNQFSEERERADREKRSTLYLNFLTAADTYAKAFLREVETCTQEIPSTLYDHPTVAKMEAVCHERVPDKFPDIAKAFYDVQNQVYVFGSDEASAISLKVAKEFPGNLVLDLGADRRTSTFNRESFATQIGKFRRVACMEIPAKPRSNC